MADAVTRTNYILGLTGRFLYLEELKCETRLKTSRCNTSCASIRSSDTQTVSASWRAIRKMC
jgi:hypothetical protein